MALLFINEIDKDVRLGVWEMEENLNYEQFASLTLYDRLMSLSDGRRKETASVYSLLFAMTGNRNLVIGHEPSGKPYVEGYKIGISHTKGFVSVILSTSCDVAVDIEYINTRVLRIADRFLREDEKPNALQFSKEKKEKGDKDVVPDVIPTLLFWCAKETMYKYYSDEHLALQDIKIEQITSNGIDNGNIICQNTLSGETKTLEYKVNDSTVLTYLV